MIKSIEHFDEELFLYLNSLHIPHLDKLMVFVSSYAFWCILFVLFAAILFFYNRNLKEIIFYGGSTVLTVVFTNIVKLFVKRPRPIHHQEWEGIIHSIDKYSDHYSFFSSHAASVFCFCFFVLLSLPKHRWIGYIALIFAFIISYSRIYVGKHFPGDVIVGIIVGILFAFLGVYLNRKFAKVPLKN